MTTSEQFEAAETMQKHGGSFVKALAECYFRADELNKLRLVNAFHDYFQKYGSLREVHHDLPQ